MASPLPPFTAPLSRPPVLDESGLGLWLLGPPAQEPPRQLAKIAFSEVDDMSDAWSGSTEGLSRLRHQHVVLEWKLEQPHG
jgi:hypothetical protein